MIQSRSWAVRFDEGRHWRARIGFVLIATERNIEHEMIQLAPAGVGMHFSRVNMEGAVNVEHLDAQLEGLAAAARLILPGESPGRHLLCVHLRQRSHGGGPGDSRACARLSG